MTKAQQDFLAAKAEAQRFTLSRFRANARKQWKEQKRAEKKK